jgi:hypothetical protein
MFTTGRVQSQRAADRVDSGEKRPVVLAVPRILAGAEKTVMRAVRVVGAVALALSAACDDGFGPRTWDATPVTSVIYSLSRPDLIGQPSAYDFVNLRRIVVESPGATGGWDVALAEQNGQLVFLTAGMFPGIDADVMIAETSHRTLAAALVAPSDTAEYSRGPVMVRDDAVYIVRTRTEGCVTFGAGPFYGKFQVLSVDAALGAIEIAVVRNPYCTDRDLIPPES